MTWINYICDELGILEPVNGSWIQAIAEWIKLNKNNIKLLLEKLDKLDIEVKAELVLVYDMIEQLRLELEIVKNRPKVINKTINQTTIIKYDGKCPPKTGNPMPKPCNKYEKPKQKEIGHCPNPQLNKPIKQIPLTIKTLYHDRGSNMYHVTFVDGSFRILTPAEYNSLSFQLYGRDKNYKPIWC
jgi:hypothetical protein